MGIVFSTRTPANNHVSPPGTMTTLYVVGSATGYPDEFLAESKVYWRKNAGTWQVQSKEWQGTEQFSHSVALSLAPGDSIQWYVWALYFTGSTWTAGISSTWKVYAAADTTNPTIGSVVPSAGEVAPEGTGIEFSAALNDDYIFKTGTLYIDGSPVETWTTPGTKSHVEKISLGAHTYRWTAEDQYENTADTGTVNITVINGLPEVPSGTITVAGETGAVEVANLGNVLLSWPAFLDGNPEDSLTYTVEYQIDSGGWIEIASGLSATSTYWTPDDGLGSAEIRVKANDGTGDSGYLSRSSITVMSSQSPNEPTLTSPVGGEEWREGETHAITWTEAGTEHPEGLACTYEIQFSADGTFADAVTITSDADDESYSWTLATDLV